MSDTPWQPGDGPDVTQFERVRRILGEGLDAVAEDPRRRAAVIDSALGAVIDYGEEIAAPMPDGPPPQPIGAELAAAALLAGARVSSTEDETVAAAARLLPWLVATAERPRHDLTKETP